MDRAISQALASLVPGWNSALPPELLELAASLLAQSRNQASSLKAEEEIARTYTCSHLACERAARVTATPTKTPPTTSRKPVRTVPRPPYSVRHKRKRESTISEAVPSWAMPVIRALCKRLDAPAAPAHIFAGVSSILTLPPPTDDSVGDDEMEQLRSLSIESLIVAVYILVRTRLLGVETDPIAYPAQRDKALTVLGQLRKGEAATLATDSASVNDWMRAIRRGCWAELDWFANVSQGAGLSLNELGVGPVNDYEGSRMDDDETLVHGSYKPDGLAPEKPYLQPGLGTMDRVDYLSEEKRADYQVWKNNILARIERMEKAERSQKLG
ncbi:MAG: hypothetical protein Q9166_003278 [cf. Caloplaca sp. 2 TL-2023]